MKWDHKDWKAHADQLQEFVSPMAQVVGRLERRKHLQCYVQGLLLPGQRKSIEPMADKLQMPSQDLQQFVKDSPWSCRHVWRVLRQEVIPLLLEHTSGHKPRAWIVDETGWPKKGTLSVGVAHQYCSPLGKRANCQVCVELAVDLGDLVAPVAARLFMPESWTSEPKRCKAAGVPKDIGLQTKPQIALELIEEALEDGVKPGCVLADSVYGNSLDFRAALWNLGLEFFMQVSPTNLQGYTSRVAIEKKKTRSYVDESKAGPSSSLLEIARSWPKTTWKKAKWSRVDGTLEHTRIGWAKVYLKNGLRKEEGDLEELWLVVDWPKNQPEPYNCYLAHFQEDAEPTLDQCVDLSRRRWHIEQYFLRAKDDLGLDHYEGRSWQGLHHHLVLTAIAYLFIVSRWKCCHKQRGKKMADHLGKGTPKHPAMAHQAGGILPILQKQISRTRG